MCVWQGSQCMCAVRIGQPWIQFCSFETQPTCEIALGRGQRGPLRMFFVTRTRDSLPFSHAATVWGFWGPSSTFWGVTVLLEGGMDDVYGVAFAVSSGRSCQTLHQSNHVTTLPAHSRYMPCVRYPICTTLVYVVR